MKKRFTDTEIWNKEWFMSLKPKHKCLIKYLFDTCDASGVWNPNWKLASLQIGEGVTLKDLSFLPADQYEVLKTGKIFLPDFINFQYGQLSEASPAHKPVFNAINKNNLNNRVFNRVSDTLQEKEEDKDKEKETEMDKEEDKDFGKSENLLNDSLIPTMLQMWKQKNPNYPTDEHDFPALRKFSEYICKLEGISYQPREPDVQKKVLINWEIISHYVVNHQLYSGFNLQQVYNYRKNIVTEIKNAKSNSANGKAKPGSKVTGSGLEQEFTKRYKQG